MNSIQTSLNSNSHSNHFSPIAPTSYDIDSIKEKLNKIVDTKYNHKNIISNLANDFRTLVRNKKSDGVSSGCCKGHVQLNYVCLDKKYLSDFTEFCLINPQAFPILEISLDKTLPNTCPLGIDVTHDIGRYYLIDNKERNLEGHGSASIVENIEDIYTTDFVSIAYGCSFSLDQAFIKEGYNVKHINENKCVSIYQTKIPVNKYGVFNGGFLVVTMRPFKKQNTEDILQLTKRFKAFHGQPIYYGHDYKNALGIDDLSKTRWGEVIKVEDDEIPFFWACGLTFISVIENSIDVDFAGTSDFDTLLVSDLMVEDLIDLA